MMVYRIENYINQGGPYQSPAFSFYKLHNDMAYTARSRTPHISLDCSGLDIHLNSICDVRDTLDMDYSEDIKFGCESIEQLFTWFNEDERTEIMDTGDYTVVSYEVPDSRVIRLNKQVVYDSTVAKLYDTSVTGLVA